ncbi:MAG: hypothetical protein JST06_07370 [Bacteroidetes bacterium]|nr:hypothetical protein [Bacteroidota bacterium]MBS1628997.1 hypothetical protein [Bacteroidota bacterium]
MDSLQLLQDKLRLLLRRHHDLKKEWASFQVQIVRQEEEIQRLNILLQKATQENMALQINHTLPDAASRKEARNRLDAVIADIDKLLSSLHE